MYRWNFTCVRMSIGTDGINLWQRTVWKLSSKGTMGHWKHLAFSRWKQWSKKMLLCSFRRELSGIHYRFVYNCVSVPSGLTATECNFFKNWKNPKHRWVVFYWHQWKKLANNTHARPLYPYEIQYFTSTSVVLLTENTDMWVTASVTNEI